MGQDISQSEFSAADFTRFQQRVGDETALLRQWWQQGLLASGERVAGFELEAWLLDHNHFPRPCNQPFLARMADPLVVPELSQFNIELNGTPQPLSGHALTALETELTDTWHKCLRMAHEEEATAVAIGTLPTLRERDLDLASMTPSSRYVALNRQVLQARAGAPLTLKIDGIQQLDTVHEDVMLEAAATSFQVHLQVAGREMSRYLNASTILCGPLLALSANAPFLFGRTLWHETRIPLFEQSVNCGDSDMGRRVTFGHGYVGPDPTELFSDNLARFPVLLPLLTDTPAAEMAHLRLHNGTIWRWVRPLVGFDATGCPRLRIEQRVMPAGPTMLDMMANAAFYYGVVHMLATQPLPPERVLPFEQARANFYAAAQHGLDARLYWMDGQAGSASDLLESLLPLAEEGLTRLDTDAHDIERYIDVLTVRLRTRRNGAAWQLAHYDAHNDFFRLMADYQEHQRSGMPVHEWPI